VVLAIGAFAIFWFTKPEPEPRPDPAAEPQYDIVNTTGGYDDPSPHRVRYPADEVEKPLETQNESYGSPRPFQPETTEAIGGRTNF
jgi:hypothetical protein